MASTRPLRYDSSVLKRKEETEELLVFGYSCKLFRDDEKALYIDQGKHLIPWMGDDALKIDRYDVRGTVYDLRPLEPLGGGASDALWTSLSDAERKVEQLCDEERYRALFHNEAEEALYQEEELKRLHQALDPQNSYGQVAYSYDNETEQDTSESTSSKEPCDQGDEEDEPFIPPQNLDIPVGMVLPERTKLNAIIEKTASFINSQGPQMEIILKMKQANNPQFSFLSFDCPLHAYYRHLLVAIKTGRYKTRQQRKQEEQTDLENSEHYLHPSLATATKPVELAPSIPSISYKPSADCAYSMLVSKIKDRHSKLADDNIASESSADGQGQDASLSGTDQSIIAPPSDIQVIIDKMASYVIKNGRDFESVVRSKGDDRFAFLDSGHRYHPYYEHKVRVYQGIEAPLNFSAASTCKSTSSPKLNQNSLPKKLSPEKKQRPILLPGYGYSDDSSESDGDESDDSKVDSKGKPKLAPVSFSIKKPKEADILKEVKSALPVEEDSSEGEVEGDEVQSSKPTNPSPDVKPAIPDAEPEPPASPGNPEDEMRRLQQLLKEKEKQLREQEKRKQEDIFPLEISVTPTIATPCLPPLPPLPTVSLPPVKDVIQVEPVVLVRESVRIRDLERNKNRKDVDNTPPMTKKDLVPTVTLLNTEEFLNEISEADVIDLTDDTPKVSDTTRLERKRKAAAFLSRLHKGKRSSKNGATHPASDSDAASRHSTPSPTRLKREKVESSNFHEAHVPRTSLMARLAASTHMPRQPMTDRKSTGKEKSRSHQKSESPVKSAKDKDHRQKSKRRKESSSTSESDEDRSRSRSRSESYSRSPSKRRQGDDSDTEEPQQRSHSRRHHGGEASRYHQSQSQSKRERGRDRPHRYGYSHGPAQGRVRERGQGHNHSKQASDNESSN